jgi:hypothetical protein
LERALQLVVEVLQTVVTATILILVLVIFLSPFIRHPGCNGDCAAVANLRTINSAEVAYRSTSGGIYGAIADLITAGLLDEAFTGTKAGYAYTVATSGANYTAEAIPVSTNTGRFGYYSFPNGVVRYSTSASLAPTGQSGRSVR